MTNKIFRKIFLTFLFAGFVLSSFAGCGKKSNGKSDETMLNKIVAVKTVGVVNRDFTIKKLFAGNLEGREQANIVSKISERITHLNIAVGQNVKKGQVLMSLDKTGPTSQILQAEANMKNLEKNLKRMKSLYAEGAISQQSLDEIQTGYEIARANYDAARSAVELTSPISGIVTALNVSLGDLAVPGALLATIADIGQMKMKLNVTDNEVHDLKQGGLVDIFSEANRAVTVKGKISEIARSADVESRSFEVKAQFQNTKDNWFRPGMFCKAEIALSKKTNILAIPNAAILRNSNETYVFIANGSKAVKRSIVAGVTDGEYTEITGGLSSGDNVVYVGMNDLKEGTPLNIVQ